MTYKKNIFLKKLNLQPPHELDICGKNFCQLKNQPIPVQFSLSTPHENIRMLSWVHRKATGWNGFSKNHNLRKEGLFLKFCFFDACFLTIHKTNPTKSDENLDFTGKLQNFVSTSIYPNKDMLQKILLSDAPQSSLSAQFLSASINAVRLNISKTFFIVTLPPSMGSSQRVMKSMSSFNTRTVPVLEHIH